MNYDPDTHHIIEDDAECVRLLEEYKKDASVWLQAPPEKHMQVAWHCFEREHHWCQASYHRNHEDRRDLGFVILMLPKNFWSKEMAAGLFEETQRDNSWGTKIVIERD